MDLPYLKSKDLQAISVDNFSQMTFFNDWIERSHTSWKVLSNSIKMFTHCLSPVVWKLKENPFCKFSSFFLKLTLMDGCGSQYGYEMF